MLQSIFLTDKEKACFAVDSIVVTADYWADMIG
jgi:hypothetical protein